MPKFMSCWESVLGRWKFAAALTTPARSGPPEHILICWCEDEPQRNRSAGLVPIIIKSLLFK